jgi:hypothetical protein
LPIYQVRGLLVALDSDLAIALGSTTKAVNQAVKRNSARFPPGWAFQVDDHELRALQSQTVTAKGTRGGRRTPPWVFTEHGVVLLATLLRSPAAIALSQFIVEVFVEARRAGAIETKGSIVAKAAATIALGGAVGQRLQGFVVRIMDSIVDQKSQATLRDEGLALMAEGIGHLKERLKKVGFENDEIAARASKLLAEAELGKAQAAQIRADVDAKDLKTLANKLRLVLEAERAIAAGELDGFLAVLESLGRP